MLWLFSENVIFYEAKSSMFYNVQTTYWTFVSKNWTPETTLFSWVYTLDELGIRYILFEIMLCSFSQHNTTHAYSCWKARVKHVGWAGNKTYSIWNYTMFILTTKPCPCIFMLESSSEARYEEAWWAHSLMQNNVGVASILSL